MRPVEAGTVMAYKIAVTSSDGKQVDLHFGHTNNFHIFEVDETTSAWEFIEKRIIPEKIDTSCQSADCGTGCGQAVGTNQAAETGGCLGHNDARLDAVIVLLSDCTYILTSKVGPKPHMFLKRAGITALESPAEIGFAVSKVNAYHLRYADINREK
jgi:predicted Fe-Mo cluster-binding NifX family protein